MFITFDNVGLGIQKLTLKCTTQSPKLITLFDFIIYLGNMNTSVQMWAHEFVEIICEYKKLHLKSHCVQLKGKKCDLYASDIDPR